MGYLSTSEAETRYGQRCKCGHKQGAHDYLGDELEGFNRFGECDVDGCVCSEYRADEDDED